MALIQDEIQRLVQDTFPGQVVVKQTVTSTQKLAKQADQGQAQAFLATEQTAGYGKQQRKFYSPPQTGLYMSVLIPNVAKTELAQAGLFTTGLANEVATVLERYYPGKMLGLKWVNDVLLAGKKVCGILVEAQLQGDRVSWVVGIGINLSTTTFPKTIAGTAGRMGQNDLINQNCLAADLIKAVWQLKDTYQRGAFLEEYQDRLVLMNRPVTLQLANRQSKGVVRGIDQQGRLLVQLADGQLHAFSDGDVIKVR